jgi:prepilin peptidase CpaA
MANLHPVQIAIFVVLGVALVVSLITDLRSRQILDVVTFPTIGLCLLLRAAWNLSEQGGSWSALAGMGLLSGVIGLLIGGVLFAIIGALGGMGGGDVKLVAAVGAAVGFPLIVPCLIFIGIAGGVQAMAVMAWRGEILKTFAGMGAAALRKVKIGKDAEVPRVRTKIPYGVAIVAGTVWGLWWTFSQAAAATPQ